MAVLLMAAALLGAGLVVFWMEPPSVLSVIERLTPNIIYRVRTDRPVVALSFDDGPHPTFTLEILEIPHRHDAKATFFLISSNDPAPGPRSLPRNCPRDPIRCRVRTTKTENRTSDSRNGRKYEPVPALLPLGRVAPVQSDCL